MYLHRYSKSSIHSVALLSGFDTPQPMLTELSTEKNVGVRSEGSLELLSLAVVKDFADEVKDLKSW